MASRGEEVWVRPFCQEQPDQLEILLVDGEVQGAAAVTLLLQDGRNTRFVLSEQWIKDGTDCMRVIKPTTCGTACAVYLCVDVSPKIHHVLYK